MELNQTKIPGVLYITLDIHDDDRGWFKESYQAAKLASRGFPEFHPVQSNVSFNKYKGVTRGLHAEPWEKYISLASGSAFAAIVDLRSGAGFGRCDTFELTPSCALFVPRGCANSFQTLEDDVIYTYLVNDHWSPAAEYHFVNVFDEQLNIAWPIPQSKAILSEQDVHHPPLSQMKPLKSSSEQAY